MATTATLTATDYLKYANLQMAAEAFIRDEQGVLYPSGLRLEEKLVAGNGHASVFTEPQAKAFAAQWVAIDQKANTGTGFSGTLFKNKDTGELVMSLRSTEFIDDSARDNQATNAMEIAESGYALGQIRDMEAWFKELKTNGSIGAGQQIDVTGYSLGGHLATVFNQLHHAETTTSGQSLIKRVVTFNGAGVGEVVKSGETLQSLVNRFNTLSTNANGQAITFTDSNLGALYARAREALKNGGNVSNADYAALQSVTQGVGEPAFLLDAASKQQAKLIWNAIDRITVIRAEAARVPLLSSGTGGSPKQVYDKDIDQEKLDYQMAVLMVRDWTSSTGIVKGLQQAYGSKAYGGAYGNQFDVVGDTSPSAVSNSQLHWGTDVRVFIEDQPLVRGGVVLGSAMTSLVNFGVKLLVDGYASKDFGDTHSLVLLVDSLNVQNALLQLMPADQRASAQPALNAILEQASYLAKKDGAALVGTDQGKAEGDVLENVLNALAELALGPGKGTLKGSPEGNTWWDTNDTAGYTGRTSFYKLLEAIVGSDSVPASDLYKKVAAGQLVLNVAPSSALLASTARGDFGAYWALSRLSPFVVSGGDALASTVGPKWSQLYTDWLADKAKPVATTDPYDYKISNQWLTDRAEFLARKNWLNSRNNNPVNSNSDVGGDASPYLSSASKFEYFEDVASGFKIAQGFSPSALTPAIHRYYFADDAGRTFTGGTAEDHLYGGRGNDTLNGDGDSDYLEGSAGVDSLIGGTGGDTLVGGAGDDVLDGGAEGDLLYGGDGKDTYVIAANSGTDVIQDSDGSGIVKLAGRVLSGTGYVQSDTPDSRVWVDYSVADNAIIYLLNKLNGELTIKGYGSTVVVKKFISGNLGITVPEPITIMAAVIASHTYDLTTHDADQKYEYDRPTWPAGEGATLYNASQPDTWYPGTAAAEVHAGSVLGTSSADLIEGGAALAVGTSLLRGSGGADQIFAQTFQSVSAAVAAQAQALSLTTSYYLLDGGNGNDTMIGSAAKDVLFGGDGSDVLVGGAGDDAIMSDGSAGYLMGNDSKQGAWSLLNSSGYLHLGLYGATLRTGIENNNRSELGYDDIITYSTSPLFDTDFSALKTITTDSDVASLKIEVAKDSAGQPVYVKYAYHSLDPLPFSTAGYFGNDTIYAGTGNDSVNSGKGDDLVDGGDGADKLAGYDGRDTIYGAEGDDTIWGDFQADPSAKNNDIKYLTVTLKNSSIVTPDRHGDDYLDGGKGADKIMGNGGSDTLLGGDGKDSLYGDQDSGKVSGTFAGADWLDGGADDDYLCGDGGQDTLLGGTGNDLLLGDAEDDLDTDQKADYLSGGEGNDTLLGYGGDDTLLADDGNDSVEGGKGNDLILAGRGQDTLWGDEGDDTIYGGTESDQLSGDDGADILWGDGGKDTLLGGAGGDTLWGGEGGDALKGGAGDDVLVGGDGSDVMDGEAGNDVYQVSISDIEINVSEQITDASGENTLEIIDGAPPVLEGVTADGTIILKFAEGKRLQINNGMAGTIKNIKIGSEAASSFSAWAAGQISTDVNVVAGNGQAAFGGAGDDTLAATAGSIEDLYGGKGDDLYKLDGGGATVNLNVGDGKDTVTGGVYAKTLATRSTNKIQFGEGIDAASLRLAMLDNNDDWGPQLYLQYGQGKELLQIKRFGYDIPAKDFYRPFDSFVFADKSVLTWDALQARGVVINTAGFQFKWTDGTGANDIISGNSYSETIEAGMGDDTIDGGAGNDVLRGQEGNDCYLFGIGSGVDTIEALGRLATDADIVSFKSSVLPSDILWIRYGDDLIARIRNTEDRLKIVGAYTNNPINGFKFSGNVTLNMAALKNATVSQQASQINDVIYFSGSDSVDALAGNDAVLGGMGNDSMQGGSGDDSLYGKDGNDDLQGGIGLQDFLNGGAGNDILTDEDGAYFVGGDGNDKIVGVGGVWNALIDGVNRNYVVDAGSGDDYIDVSGPSVNMGRGNDVLVVRPGTECDLYVVGPVGEIGTIKGETKTIRFGSGIKPSDLIIYGASTSDVRVRWSADYEKQLTLKGFRNFSAVDQQGFKFVFDDAPGVVLSYLDVYDRANTPTDKRDNLIGTASADYINALGEGDNIYGRGGNDTLLGGSGNDWINGGDGDDSLVAGTGVDTLYGVSGDDVLVASNEHTEFFGGAGRDTFLVGTPSEVVVNQDASIAEDILQFDVGVRPEDITVRKGTTYWYGDYSGDAFLTVPNAASLSNMVSVQIKSLFQSSSPGGVAEVRFASAPSTVWRIDDLRKLAVIGSGGDDKLTGFSFVNDNMMGGAGNDILSGDAGNDSLDGGLGFDTLKGGVGDDVYIYQRGDSQDIIFDDGGADTLRFGMGILPTDVTLTRVSSAPVDFNLNSVSAYASDSLVVSIKGGGQIWVPNFFSASGGLESIEFSGGVSGGVKWTGATLTAAINNMAGSVDAKTGGAGNDVFQVDHSNDTIRELVNSGTDSVVSSVSYTLPSNIEDISLTGVSNIAAIGNDLNNHVIGNDGDNLLDGGLGIDTLQGGLGNDVYVVDNESYSVNLNYINNGWHDYIVELANGGVDTLVTNGYRGYLPENVENLISKQCAVNGMYASGELVSSYSYPNPYSTRNTFIKYRDAYQAYDGKNPDTRTFYGGNALNNVLDVRASGSASDIFGGAVLDGGAGADTMMGGSEDTYYYVDNVNEVVIEPDWAGSLYDTMISYNVSLTVAKNIENIELLGNSSITATGNQGNNDLRGSHNYANNSLAGLGGNDTYYVGLNDVVVEKENEGVDRVVIDMIAGGAAASRSSGKTFYLSDYANVENISSNGDVGWGGTYWRDLGVHLVGNNVNNEVNGSFQDDILEGGDGDDFVEDQYWAIFPTLDYLYQHDRDSLYGGNGNDHLLSHWGLDLLDGGAGDDTLESSSRDGNCTLQGGVGNDTYLVTAASDVISELTGAGIDAVESSVSFSLASISNVENLTLNSKKYEALVGTGNSLSNELDGNEYNNTLTGLGGNDTLMGDAGDDTMIGGVGDDVYWIDSANDVVTEQAGEGLDLVIVSGAYSYTLGSNVEKGTAQLNAVATTLSGNTSNNSLIGSNYADILRGGGGNDTLSGGKGNDMLDGGLGDDSLTGGQGNDTFVVDSLGDVVVEVANAGTDTVQSSISYALGDNVECLVLTGAASGRMATGNALNNVITGGSGADTLDGGVGVDVLLGGDGDDNYVVDNINDVISEGATGGSDWVTSSAASYALGVNVEGVGLAYGAATALSATGNSLANEVDGNEYNNTLTGLDGNDTLVGDAGDDTMIGGVGDDVYWVDSVNDVVTEQAGEGYDQVIVYGASTYVLSGNVERGNAQYNAVATTLDGNVSNNSLVGSIYADVLRGGAGNDMLSGGKGNDSLYGGEGDDAFSGQVGTDALYDTSLTSSDTYSWGRGQGIDTTVDSGGIDQLNVLAGVTTDQVWLRHVSNDLEVSVIGSTDKFVITNWYASSANRIESFKLADNKTLTAAKVQSLVDAMATFAPPAAGQTTLPSNYQATLNPVIAANWV